MKKSTFLLVKALLLLFPITLLFASCKKEIHKRAFEAKIKTWYRVAPLPSPVTFAVNGVDKTGFAYFPGGGTGNATHIGNTAFYFNQLVYSTTGAPPPEGSVAAPVSDVPGYPVLGGPLPLIQAGDFTELASIVSSLNIPASVHGKIINSVFVNKAGDAIYTSAITGSGSTFPISATVVGFNGKALIVGGSGKFEHAVGEIDYNGYFNVADANDAEYEAKGWIDY